MNAPDYIFVYGTLRPPRAATPETDARFYPLVADQVRSATPAVLGSADLYDIGAFPGAVPGQGVIIGDLLEITAGALPAFDRIEGHPHFFQRARVEVQADGVQRAAWIYWAPRSLIAGREKIAGGDWHRRESEGRGLAPVPTPGDEQADPSLRTLVHRFAEAECSWMSTVRADGRAHTAPVWHVWYQGRAYVVTTSHAVKTVNISINPAVVLAHPDPVNPIIIEGWATANQALRNQLQPLFLAKYDWDLDTDAEYDTVLEITPTKMMAWGKFGEGRWKGEQIMLVWQTHG